VYVVVNAAMSADGKLSSRRRNQVAISGASDFERVDRLRAESDAVMVGVGTVLADDPRLTVKDAELREKRTARGEPANPARVVADSRARTPPDARILSGEAKTYILVSKAAPAERRDALTDTGAHIIEAGSERVAVAQAARALEAAGIDRLMVEGGGELIFSLLEADVVDDLITFVGPTVIGGREAPTLADGEGFVTGAFPALELAGVEELDGGALLRWTVQ